MITNVWFHDIVWFHKLSWTLKHGQITFQIYLRCNVIYDHVSDSIVFYSIVFYSIKSQLFLRLTIYLLLYRHLLSWTITNQWWLHIALKEMLFYSQINCNNTKKGLSVEFLVNIYFRIKWEYYPIMQWRFVWIHA